MAVGMKMRFLLMYSEREMQRNTNDSSGSVMKNKKGETWKEAGEISQRVKKGNFPSADCFAHEWSKRTVASPRSPYRDVSISHQSVKVNGLFSSLAMGHPPAVNYIQEAAKVIKFQASKAESFRLYCTVVVPTLLHAHRHRSNWKYNWIK